MKMGHGELINKLSEISVKNGHESYIVGGWVRDYKLGVDSDDIDIVVVGDGPKMALDFAHSVGGSVDIFKNYGTAKVSWDGIDVEFVTARSESYSRESRNPIVTPGTLLEDLRRRDFTINSMAISLNKKDFGRLIDPFGGEKDLENKILRTPRKPEETFFDDPLRMLRCVRFHTKFLFDIETETFEAIRKCADRLNIISSERIATELFKILSYSNPHVGICALEDTGLLEKFLPELSALDTIDDGRHKNNFIHSIKVLENVSRESDNVWLRFAALLHDIGKDRCKRRNEETGEWTFYGHPEIGRRMIDPIFKRLHLPIDKREYVKKLVGLHMRPQKIAAEGVTDSAVRRVLVDAGDDISDLLLLSKSDITTKYSDKKARLQEAINILESKIEDLKVRDWRRMFQPCINGFEIMDMFNLKKGPEVGRLKEAMKEAILDGELPNERPALIEFLNKMYYGK